MGVSTTYEYNSDEHYRALRDITNLTPLRWITLVVGVVMPALVVAVIVWSVRARGVAPLEAVVEWLPYLVLFFLWASIVPVMQRVQAKRLPKVDASVRGAQARSVDAVGYHSRGNGVGMDVGWQALKQVVETDRFFIFFYTSQCGYYLPKRKLSATDITTVRELARGALAERARVHA